MSEYIKHHGIKGQKWGIRRFQNKDGSLTDAGRKRYSIDDYNNALNKVNNAGRVVDEVKRRVNSNPNDPDMERRIRKNATNMSDYDLAKKVQRLSMEDNYTRMMMHRENLEKGESFVNKALNVSSVALQGAASALTIAILMKQLQNK